MSNKKIWDINIISDQTISNKIILDINIISSQTMSNFVTFPLSMRVM